MFIKRLCVACVLLFALAGHATADSAASTEGSVGASIMHKVDRESMPDLLEQTGIPESMKGYWTMVGQYMWDQLLTLDHDFFDAQGHVVPPGSPDLAYVASGTKVKCGRFARAWIRLGFHDCGTYSRFLNRFGCNGSVRKELPFTDPWRDFTKINPDGKSFKLISNDVFDQFRTNGVLNPAVDVAFNRLHDANAGLATSVAAYYKAKLYANTEWVGLWDASYADIVAYGALLGLARCDGPHVKFIPGRRDANVADHEDLLPAFDDDFHHTLFYFLGNGLSELDGVVLTGGAHSTACFLSGCLDTTPSVSDKAWAQEILAWNRISPPLCDNSTIVTQCIAPSDQLWLQHQQTADYLKLMVSPVTSFSAFNKQVTAVLDNQGVTNYKGLIPGANLCATTSRTCPGFQENYAFHTLMATSYFRMLQHNIPVNL